MTDLLKIRTAITTIARVAGDMALQQQKTTSTVKDTGGGGGITTQADLDAQAIVTNMLSEQFPGVPIIGEEGNTLTVSPGTAFIVDPIDGSAPYKTGAPDWATTIAYRSPEGSAGVIYLPSTDHLYVCSTRAEDDGRVEVQIRKGKEAYFVEPITPRKPQWKICAPIGSDFSDRSLQLFLNLMQGNSVRSLDNVSCNTVHFIRLFEGWADAVIMWAKTWDSAAAVVMARRLGIRVTDFSGNEPDLSVVEPQRLIFARGEEVLSHVVTYLQDWPSPAEEMRS